MIRMQTMARIILIALGIHTCIRLTSIIPTALFSFRTGEIENIVPGIISLLLTGLFMTLTIVLLILKSDHFAQRMVSIEPPQEAQLQMQWLAVVFRMICIGAGIFYLVRFADGITREISLLGMWRNGIPSRWQHIMARSVAWLCSLPIAIYLLCGAPHFVRWQVKNTLQFCSKEIFHAQAGN